MAKDKLTEKEALRKENLEETVSKTDQFYNEHKKTIWSVACAIIVVALCVFAYVKLVYQPKCAEAAQQAFPAEQSFAAGEYELALNGDGNVDIFDLVELRKLIINNTKEEYSQLISKDQRIVK